MAAKGQKFKETYSEKCKWITKSSLGSHYARCNPCRSDFNIKHGGSNDIRKHINTAKHKIQIKCLQGVSTIETFVNIPSNVSGVTSAECMVTNFIIEHNLPVNVSDHLTELIKAICPDSDIAKKYQCKRRKSTHIIHEMSRDVIRSLDKVLKTEPFSISTDGSESRHNLIFRNIKTQKNINLKCNVYKECQKLRYL